MEDIVHAHALSILLYADDAQLYLSRSPSNIDEPILQLESCLSDLSILFSENLFATHRRQTSSISHLDLAIPGLIVLSNLEYLSLKNGCGPIAGNHWLNYVTPSLLGLRRYPIGPLIARTPNWLGANGSHHTTWENPKRKHTRQYI